MTFEEQLTRAFETLTERLRGEIDQHVRRASAELVASVPFVRDPAAIEAARQELELAVAAARADAHEKGMAAGKAAGRDEALRQVTQTIAPTPADLDLSRLAEGTRAIDTARSLTEILDTLMTVASWDASGVTIWLVRGGKLHRWQATGADGEGTPAVLALTAGGVIAQAAGSNATARDEHVLAIPIAISGHVVAVFSANRQSRTDSQELLVRYAAKGLEALTAFKTARALTQPPAASVTDVSQVVADKARGEEDNSARRYARLLVSEIKLYHEPAVADGRRDRDLATRLGGEIARARVMYEQRVPSHVRVRADYFQDELVRTLADGDASLLAVRSPNVELKTEKSEV